MFNSKNKTALVTGASSGMGKVIARQLIADGFQVYVAARRTEKMEDLARVGARVLRMDLSREEEIGLAVDTILSEVDTIDVLVNNAGYGLFGPMEEIDIDEARYQFEVNIFGAARLTQLLLPAMRRKGSGTIVNISSMGGKVYTLLGAWYHATKHAIEGWSDCLRLELADFGIRVVVIEPGVIETDFGDVVADGSMKRAAGGAYAKLKQAVMTTTQKTYGQGTATDPLIVARVVSKAVSSKRPKTRYVVGKYAMPMIFIRKWLGDRMFDRVLMSQMS